MATTSKRVMTKSQRAIAVCYNETYAAAARDESVTLQQAHAIAEIAARFMRSFAYDANFTLAVQATADKDMPTEKRVEFAKSFAHIQTR